MNSCTFLNTAAFHTFFLHFWRFCKLCQRFVSSENVHCRKCSGCMSKVQVLLSMIIVVHLHSVSVGAAWWRIVFWTFSFSVIVWCSIFSFLFLRMEEATSIVTIAALAWNQVRLNVSFVLFVKWHGVGFQLSVVTSTIGCKTVGTLCNTKAETYAVCQISHRLPNQCWTLFAALWSFRVWLTLCRGERGELFYLELGYLKIRKKKQSGVPTVLQPIVGSKCEPTSRHRRDTSGRRWSAFITSRCNLIKLEPDLHPRVCKRSRLQRRHQKVTGPDYSPISNSPYFRCQSFGFIETARICECDLSKLHSDLLGFFMMTANVELLRKDGWREFFCARLLQYSTSPIL